MRDLKKNLKLFTPERAIRPAAVAAIALACFGLISLSLGQSPTTKIVQGDEFSVIGIEARTSGEQEMYGDGQIAGLWQRFVQEHILEKIPGKTDKNIYAVYTDYSGDRMGAYTALVGARVKDKTPPPSGLVLKVVPAGKYAVLTSEKGPPSTVIPDAWQRIWALEDKDALGGKRAYKSDYEIYSDGNTDPQNTHADLYIGLRPDKK